MLTRIVTQDVEPTDLDVRLAPRLNLLAGDNGLGKTFLLDLAWWALTEAWAQHPAIPRRGEGVRPTIGCGFDEPLLDAGHGGVQSLEARFDFDEQRWVRSGAPGRRLVVHARASGGFDVWDSFRKPGDKALPSLEDIIAARCSHFTSDAVWDGLLLEDRTIRCNGLLRDWLTWQFQKPALFALFSRVLAKLSPHPGEVIVPGPPRRVSLEDARDIPTITLPYGDVPVTHASAGMRRILALAYMLVWTWSEHTEAARLQNRAPLGELVLLLDEVDAHLHPTWQRVILAALFEVFPELTRSLRVQVLASTHAPLVLASAPSTTSGATARIPSGLRVVELSVRLGVDQQRQEDGRVGASGRCVCAGSPTGRRKRRPLGRSRRPRLPPRRDASPSRRHARRPARPCFPSLHGARWRADTLSDLADTHADPPDRASHLSTARGGEPTRSPTWPTRTPTRPTVLPISPPRAVASRHARRPARPCFPSLHRARWRADTLSDPTDTLS
jgi:hypothetical protein